MTLIRVLSLARIFTPATVGQRGTLFREEMMGRVMVVTNTVEYERLIKEQGVGGVLCTAEFREQLMARHCAGIKGFPALIGNLVSKFDRIPPPPSQQQQTRKKRETYSRPESDPMSPISPTVSEIGANKGGFLGGMALREEASGLADYSRGAQYRLMVIRCPPISNEEVERKDPASMSTVTCMIRYKRAVEHLYHSYGVLLLGLLVPPEKEGNMYADKVLLVNPDPVTIFTAPLLYEADESCGDEERQRSSMASLVEEEEDCYADLLVLCDSDTTMETLQYYATWPPSCVTKVKKTTKRSSVRHLADSEDDDDDDDCVSVVYEDDLPNVFSHANDNSDNTTSPSDRPSFMRPKPTPSASSHENGEGRDSLRSRCCPTGCAEEWDDSDADSASLSYELHRARLLQRALKRSTALRRKTKIELESSTAKDDGPVRGEALTSMFSSEERHIDNSTRATTRDWEALNRRLECLDVSQALTK